MSASERLPTTASGHIGGPRNEARDDRDKEKVTKYASPRKPRTGAIQRSVAAIAVGIRHARSSDRDAKSADAAPARCTGCGYTRRCVAYAIIIGAVVAFFVVPVAIHAHERYAVNAEYYRLFMNDVGLMCSSPSLDRGITPDIYKLRCASGPPSVWRSTLADVLDFVAPCVSGRCALGYFPTGMALSIAATVGTALLRRLVF